MISIFPDLIKNLPETNLPFENARVFISHRMNHQNLFMEFDEDIDLPEHSREAQIGFILKGKIKLIIDGEEKRFHKGDIDYIPSGVKHSGKIYAGYSDYFF